MTALPTPVGSEDAMARARGLVERIFLVRDSLGCRDIGLIAKGVVAFVHDEIARAFADPAFASSQGGARGEPDDTVAARARFLVCARRCFSVGWPPFKAYVRDGKDAYAALIGLERRDFVRTHPTHDSVSPYELDLYGVSAAPVAGEVGGEGGAS